MLGPTALVYTAAALGLTVWPKPQQQVDEAGSIFVLDEPNFRFDAAGSGAQSRVLLNAFKRYRGIIFLHTPPGAHAAQATGDVPRITSVNVTVRRVGPDPHDLWTTPCPPHSSTLAHTQHANPALICWIETPPSAGALRERVPHARN